MCFNLPIQEIGEECGMKQRLNIFSSLENSIKRGSTQAQHGKGKKQLLTGFGKKSEAIPEGSVRPCFMPKVGYC